jgi:hypothetical protein
MNPLIPLWIIGGPFVGLLILSFSFKGPSAMGGSMPRLAPRGRDLAAELSAPLVEPMRSDAPRRLL